MFRTYRLLSRGSAIDCSTLLVVGAFFVFEKEGFHSDLLTHFLSYEELSGVWFSTKMLRGRTKIREYYLRRRIYV